MKIIQGTTEIQFDFPTAVTLGKFDGLHRGHQKLIRTLKENRKPEQKVVVFTFDISPSAQLDGKPSPVLTTREEKRRLMEAMGVDILIEYPFTQETSRMGAEEFLREVLLKRLCMRTLAVGPDCGFGYQRSGNVGLLERLSPQLGYRLLVVEKEITRKDGRVISSSRVREELIKGDIEEVNRLLGYLYSINGHSVDTSGKIISASAEKAGDGWVIAQGEGQYKLILPPGEYFSKVWIGDKYFKSITKILQNSAEEGQLLTELKEEILTENTGFTPEIGLIAQYKA
ncbi:MAG: FAD synthetase family protein [Lachnospiraceae bacterium]|nr:FAD synthetase family protein [Lachnospiraceae bacterium]